MLGAPSVPVLRDGPDCAYSALTSESVDDLVIPELREHYFRHRSEWLVSESCVEHLNNYVRCRLEPCCKMCKGNDRRTPGLFKVAWSGDGFVGLCSKTYYCFRATDKSLDRVCVRAGISVPHLCIPQTRGARGRGDYGPGGRVENAMHSRPL